jgi:hypothetical protein
MSRIGIGRCPRNCSLHLNNTCIRYQSAYHSMSRSAPYRTRFIHAIVRFTYFSSQHTQSDPIQ